jgi:hypothetical protein
VKEKQKEGRGVDRTEEATALEAAGPGFAQEPWSTMFSAETRNSALWIVY